MNMVDSYLCEVGRWLPGFKRKAQLTRIREDLSEFLSDARDDADRRKRLAEFGRPVVVAARYADYPHVIPGMLAPSYIVVVLVAIVTALLINASLVIPRGIQGEFWLNNIGLVFSTTLRALPILFTVITLVFAGLGYAVQRRARAAKNSQ